MRDEARQPDISSGETAAPPPSPETPTPSTSGLLGARTENQEPRHPGARDSDNSQGQVSSPGDTEP